MNELDELQAEQRRIQKAGQLHWFHWFIVVASLVLTLSAWYFTKTQVEQKTQNLFDRQAEQIVELVVERMRHYEDALQGGVATIHSQSQGIDSDEWQRYAEALKLGVKYPGINGIGVIFHVPRYQSEAFIEDQRILRPYFKIHPEHNEKELMPITFIEPEATNAKAVGLDMAHETNRYQASKKSRSTGLPQMTAPIVLVQDSQKTPGFLLFAPFYQKHFDPMATETTEQQRIERFIGMVYAPFIMTKLMRGTLGQEKRQVLVKISDEDDVLYDEHQDNTADTTFLNHYELDIYGRKWTFDIIATPEFIQQTQSSQPIVILMGGIIIDTLLLTLFLLLAKSNRQAVNFAERMAGEYQSKASDLSIANSELEEFAYRTSHDLRSPLTSSISLLEIADKAIEEDDKETAKTCMEHTRNSLSSLKKLVEDLLNLTKVKMIDEHMVSVNIEEEVDKAIEKLRYMDHFEHIHINKDIQFSEPLNINVLRFAAIIENLLSNAIKYYDPDKENPSIFIKAYKADQCFCLDVIDNGLGVPEGMEDSLFTMFKRLHPRTSFGSGLGLYMVRKSAQLMGGDATYSSNGEGSTFSFRLALDKV